MKTGNPLDFAKCDTKLASKWPAIESKGAGMCPTEGDQSAVAGDVTSFTACVADKLDGESVGNCFRAVPATGQTTSYGAGDDGDLQPGATLQYVDNGDGTVTDMNTGLMWEKKILSTGFGSNWGCGNEAGTCGNPHHAHNRYSWTVNNYPASMYDGTVVSIFLEQLNNRCNNDTTVSCTTNADCSVPGGPCGFAGYRDWRLPTHKELFTLANAVHHVRAVRGGS